MFLLDKPFLSPYLLETIKNNMFRLIATPEAKKLMPDETLNWISEDDAIRLLHKISNQPIYTNSENTLNWINTRFQGTNLAYQINTLKDKFKFRSLIKDIYPDFSFKQLDWKEIQQLNVKDQRFPFVVKPSIGFFSIGVHIVTDKKEWKRVKNILSPENLNSNFPESVLNTNTFITEEYISGKEFAVDYYHDVQGKVVILNILEHLFSSGKDTSDRVYTSSKSIIHQYKDQFEALLNRIGHRLSLKNFPAHAEVRIRKNGEIIPIEINPLRFGGWCTTADLMGLGIGMNPYEYFIQNKEPNWDEIFKGKEDKLYSIIVLNNNSGIEASDILKFDYSKLEKEFEKPILLRKFDLTKDSIFGFLFTETSQKNKKELFDILSSDLKNYIISV